MSAIEKVVSDMKYLGCSEANMGRGKVPPRYAILVDPDGMYSFWIDYRGRESCIHWNKWAVLRGAKADAVIEARKLAQSE